MSGTIAPFRERYARALADRRLFTNLLTFQRAWKTSREATFSRLAREGPELGVPTPTFAEARACLIGAKDRVLADPTAVRARFIAAARAAGTVVHEVAGAGDARETILRLLRERDVRLLAKGKSMVAEEIFLNAHLEQAGVRVVETDLGE